MMDFNTLGLFLAAVFALFLSPGPNMAFVLTHGVAHGPRGGIAAALGIALADLLLTLLTATGITALIAAWPHSFDLVRGLGALYLLWLAIQALRKPSVLNMNAHAEASLRSIFFAAMWNCLLNPKALLFFMVFLPQFVETSKGQVSLQLAVLGIILSLFVLMLNVLLGILSGRIISLFVKHKTVSTFQSRLLATVFIALALRLMFLERPHARL